MPRERADASPAATVPSRAATDGASPRHHAQSVLRIRRSPVLNTQASNALLRLCASLPPQQLLEEAA